MRWGSRCSLIVVLRTESALFFANADAVRDGIRSHVDDDAKAIVLDAETVPAIDLTAVNMLTRLAGELHREGVELVLARDVGAVRELAADRRHRRRRTPAHLPDGEGRRGRPQRRRPTVTSPLPLLDEGQRPVRGSCPLEPGGTGSISLGRQDLSKNDASGL